MSNELTAFNITLLLQQLRQGDENAFTHIYNLYSKPLYINILRMVKDEATAKEILQELFVKIWVHREDLDEKRSFKSYLYTVASNLVYDYFRQIARTDKMKVSLQLISPQYYTHSEEALIQKANLSMINEAINMLPPQRKHIYIQCKLQGKSYAEVGNELGISTSTIRDHIVKANRLVRLFFLSNPEITTIPLLMFFIPLIKS